MGIFGALERSYVTIIKMSTCVHVCMYVWTSSTSKGLLRLPHRRDLSHQRPRPQTLGHPAPFHNDDLIMVVDNVEMRLDEQLN